MSSNLRMLGKLTVMATVMFGFGWALIPLYNTICEVTGTNVLTRTDKGAAEFARNTQVDATRTVTIEFDANSHGPWRFKPETNAVKVHPGELTTVMYDLVNTEDRLVAGQAIPSYAPQEAAQYFRKIECFCFAQQTLTANQSRRFPVVFVVDPQLPADVGTITLSYTFFEIAGPVGAPQAARDTGTPSTSSVPQTGGPSTVVPANAAAPVSRGG